MLVKASDFDGAGLMAGAANQFSLLAAEGAQHTFSNVSKKSKKKNKKNSNFKVEIYDLKADSTQSGATAQADEDSSFQIVKGKGRQTNGSRAPSNELSNKHASKKSTDSFLKVVASATGKARTDLVGDWVTKVRSLLRLVPMFHKIYP